MQLPGLLQRVQGEVQNSMNGYPPSESLAREIERLIVPPQLGNRSGVFGALALAARL